MQNTLRAVRALAVRIPDELSQVLQAETERTGRSTGELVREALNLSLAFVAAVRVSDEHENLRLLFEDRLRQAVARDD
jgi:predicted DNA-binding protein